MTVNLPFKLWNCQQPRMMYMEYFLGVFGSSYIIFNLTRSKRLVLMTYYGVILSLSGYQADEAKIRAQYKAIVDRYVRLFNKDFNWILYRIETRYPTGAIWILNRVGFLLNMMFLYNSRFRLKSWGRPMTPKVLSKLCRKVWSRVDLIHLLRLTRL